MYLWTSEEIEKILMQLDEQSFPFSQYIFSRENGRLHLLGKGGYALVYEAALRESHGEADFAIKVIGFGEKTIDSEEFCASVKAQKDLYTDKGNIVKVYDYVELWIQLDNDMYVTAVGTMPDRSVSGNYLKLQFILMEKLEQVLVREETGKYRLNPSGLEVFAEEEILRLAQHITNALQLAHNRNILHRDVKLENVFYDKNKGIYKLGDFGNAKVTTDGMASTAVYTKGYGAPEVMRSIDDRYSVSADMYSLGMLIYVLLNGLQFPDSNKYKANIKAQYQNGYILPVPLAGNGMLYKVAKKMCMFEPEDRYPSMRAVQKVLNNVALGEAVFYKTEHKQSSLIMGSVLLAMGWIVSTLAFEVTWYAEFSLIMYIFLGLNVGRMVMHVMKEDTFLLTLGAVGAGIYLLLSTEFTLVKLLFFLGMLFSVYFAGISAGGLLMSNAVCLLGRQNPEFIQSFQGYEWLAVTALSLAVVLLWQYVILWAGEDFAIKIYFKKNFYWILICIFYIEMIFFGGVVSMMQLKRILSEEAVELFRRMELSKVGVAGLTFCIIWLVREWVVMKMEKSNKKV